MLLAYEATRDMKLREQPIETPLVPMTGHLLDGKKVVLIAILRAGLGILDGMLQLMPSARVGHIGMYRDPKTLQPVEYFFKVPGKLQDRTVIVCDPMLATGNSSVAAIDLLKKSGATNIRFMCLLAAPEGVARMKEASACGQKYVAQRQPTHRDQRKSEEPLSRQRLQG